MFENIHLSLSLSLSLLEVHFGVGGCDRTDSAGRAGQE